MAGSEVFSKARLGGFCPRLCTRHLRLPQRPRAEGPKVAVSFRKPLAVLELWALPRLWLCFEHHWQVSCHGWWLDRCLPLTGGGGGDRKLATSEKVERMEIKTDTCFSGSPGWQEATGVENGPALCYINHTKPWSSLALMVASCLRNQLSWAKGFLVLVSLLCQEFPPFL